MSYAQRKELSGNRGVSIALTAAVVGSLMYAIITGLAYNVIKKTAENLKVINVEEQPPPPEKPPPPPKDMPKVPPPPMTPPPLVRTEAPPPPIQTVTTTNIPPVAPRIIAPPAPPPPPPAPRQTQPRSLSGSLQGLIRNEDYPQSAIDNNEEGTVSVTLTVGPTGRVVACSPSGGTATLRSATCRMISSRARYSPAQDAQGNPTTATTTGTVTWRLEG